MSLNYGVFGIKMEKIQILKYLKYQAEAANSIVLLINNNYYIRNILVPFCLPVESCSH